MRKRFSKSILVGTLTVIATAIVAGPAYGREYVQNDQQQVTNSQYIPGYTDVPNVFRLHATLTPAERQQLDAAVAGTSSDSSSSTVHQPGVTSGSAAIPPQKWDPGATTSFVPGYSDFPNVLRNHSTLTPTERKQLDAAVASTSSVSSSSDSGFSWSDAGIGIAVGIGVLGCLAILAIGMRRHGKATPVPA